MIFHNTNLEEKLDGYRDRQADRGTALWAVLGLNIDQLTDQPG